MKAGKFTKIAIDPGHGMSNRGHGVYDSASLIAAAAAKEVR